jgi:tetratricopeptide (TPR) repeat protein
VTLLDTPYAELVARGDEFRRRRQFSEAKRYYGYAAVANPSNGIALARLGSLFESIDDANGAIDAYERALECALAPRNARRNLATLLVRRGRVSESLPYWQAEYNEDADGLDWIHRTVNSALTLRDLSLAGTYAEILAALQWGIGIGAPKEKKPARYSPPSIPKLRHDVQQFQYLQRTGFLGSEFDEPIRLHQRVIEHLESNGPNARLALNSDMMGSIRHIYNRIISRPDVARVPTALSAHWDPAEVERAYLGRPPGVVVIDNFLTPEALSGLRKFCLESTVWSANRYAHGRLGAFFQDGFNCPLLVQVAEELRVALPQVIGDRYPVQQIWGFKCGPTLPADATTHADFAAVNVNFWITPDDANTEPDSGGLTIYD